MSDESSWVHSWMNCLLDHDQNHPRHKVGDEVTLISVGTHTVGGCQEEIGGPLKG